jgi:hypothetical protein
MDFGTVRGIVCGGAMGCKTTYWEKEFTSADGKKEKKMIPFTRFKLRPENNASEAEAWQVIFPDEVTEDQRAKWINALKPGRNISVYGVINHKPKIGQSKEGPKAYANPTIKISNWHFNDSHPNFQIEKICKMLVAAKIVPEELAMTYSQKLKTYLAGLSERPAEVSDPDEPDFAPAE